MNITGKLLAVSFTLLVLLILIHPSCFTRQPRFYVVSDSPDGKYRCVVTQQPPSRGSEHNYLFTMIDNQTGSYLKGEPFTRGTDSVPSGDLKFEWSGNELKISDMGYSPQNTFASARIENGEQQWTCPGCK
jgi:hypothetical protein